MTINAAAPSTSPVYVGDGATTVFAFPFAVDSGADVQVRVDGAVLAAAEYSVNVSGRTVTLTSALATGSTLIVLDKPEINQPRDYTNQGGVPADDVERALDKLTRIVRALQRDSLAARPTLPVYATNDAAIADGRVAGEIYRTADGALRIVV